MHLQDRKLFSFGDSIYHALESSEGFAIEINPLEMMDSVLKLFEIENKSPLIKNILGKEKFDKVAARLEKKLKIPAGKITLKKINDDRSSWWSKVRKKDDMQTFLDMYLYTIAQNQGKYTGGIEDVGDQIGLFDNVGKLDIEEYLEEDHKLRFAYLERMKMVYLNRDLNKIAEMSYGKAGTDFHDLVLIKRNLKMAGRMDSLAQIRNTFFAVGAAHLPGDSGLISLLRKRGYSVEPIHSSKYLKPEDYHYTFKEVRWMKIEDENKMCSVEMPGQPTTLNLNEVIPFKLFIDLSNMFCYGLAVIPTNGQNEDTILLKMMSGYRSKGMDVLASQNINEPGNRRLEMTVRSEGYFIKFSLKIKNNKLFMLMFGAQDQEKLKAPQATKYFNSIITNDSAVSSTTTWQLLTDSGNAFSLSMPGKPVYKFVKGTEESLYDVYTYAGSDFKDGSFYNITIQNTIPGYFIQSDSIFFDGIKSRLDKVTESGVTHVSELIFNGYHAHKMVGVKKEQGVEYIFQMYLITRGNRVYMPMAVTEKNNQNSAEVQNFFKNLTFLPYQKPGWDQYTSPVNNFRTWAPAAFELVRPDSSLEPTDKKTFYSIDKHSAITYGVEVQPYLGYYWSNSDSAFFRSILNSNKAGDDSLVYYRLLSADSTGAEFLIKLHNSDQYKKTRIIFNGDTSYTLYAHIPKELIGDRDANLLFSAFSFPSRGRLPYLQIKEILSWRLCTVKTAPRDIPH